MEIKSQHVILITKIGEQRLVLRSSADRTAWTGYSFYSLLWFKEKGREEEKKDKEKTEETEGDSTVQQNTPPLKYWCKIYTSELGLYNN